MHYQKLYLIWKKTINAHQLSSVLSSLFYVSSGIYPKPLIVGFGAETYSSGTTSESDNKFLLCNS